MALHLTSLSLTPMRKSLSELSQLVPTLPTWTEVILHSSTSFFATRGTSIWQTLPVLYTYTALDNTCTR